MFAITAPAHRRGLARVALEAARTLGLPWRERLRLVRLLEQVFTLTEWELRRWDRRTLDEFVRSHTEHPAAYFLFSFLASIFFIGRRGDPGLRGCSRTRCRTSRADGQPAPRACRRARRRR
jgi:hypothetical protein